MVIFLPLRAKKATILPRMQQNMVDGPFCTHEIGYYVRNGIYVRFFLLTSRMSFAIIALNICSEHSCFLRRLFL